jgi:hypothetical protein
MRGTKKVVAVAEKPAEPVSDTAHRARPRTPEQQRLIDDHLAFVREMYAGRDPRYVAVLNSERVLWTEDLVRLFGITDQRAYVLYSAGRDLFEEGHLVHPGGIPVADTSGGFRGQHEIRGITEGRLVFWAVGARRAFWHPERGELVWLDPNSNEGLVERARAALENADVPGHYREVLQARVDNPELTSTQIAELLGVSKATFTSKLRRALNAAERP